jgi:hypothetical protein
MVEEEVEMLVLRLFFFFFFTPQHKHDKPTDDSGLFVSGSTSNVFLN